MDRIFHMKQFSLSDSMSPMKIGADALLLGAWADVKGATRVLDIGTGCGIIALMLSQRSKAIIDAIDIDSDSIREAIMNFSKSRWNDRLRAYHISLQEFAGHAEHKYQHIVTNPPFFGNSPATVTNRRWLARHRDLLSHNELLEGIHDLLHHSGKFSLILPFSSAEDFTTLAGSFRLYPTRSTIIYPKEGKPPVRILMEFSKAGIHNNIREELTVRDRDNRYTMEYKRLTGDYHPDIHMEKL